ncbi:uncharacterized protein DNG_06832 [Cephalotrichum gorgonifer]|uniref:Uncharacterized protein n=1 Tax=Cephalotrichum gorgonifer TaxID=2041049 RepID=A0AAE8N2C6_9PEZI|nr:uncharacterized protein DNG_06832 [Cephalotrichum gorgonifer]
MGAIGLLTGSAMAEPRPGPRQASDKLALLHAVQAALAIDGHDPSASAPSRSTPVLNRNQGVVLPSLDDAQAALRCYLEAIYFIPCLTRDSEDSLLARFHSVKSDHLSSSDEDDALAAPGEREDEAPKTKASREMASLYVIRHAHLVSSIRKSGRRDPMFDYSNVCYWRDLTSRLGTLSGSWKHCVDQLACRALIQMVSPAPQAHSNPGMLPGTTQDVEEDTLVSCHRFISSLYDRTGHAKNAGSFLDAYDVISAGVVFACLTHRAAASSSDRRVAELTEVVHKASTLSNLGKSYFPKAVSSPS